MKYLILLPLLVFTYLAKGGVETEPILQIRDSISKLTTIDTCDYKNERKEIDDEILQDKINLKKTSNLNRKKSKLGFFDDIGDFFQDVYDVIALKKTFGYYELPNMNPEGPYTLFDRTRTDKDVAGQLEEIKIWIKTDSVATSIYNSIYATASSGATSISGCQGGGVCQAARTAKCAAFVYIVGLKPILSSSGQLDSMINMGNSIDPCGQTERDVFYERAMSVLENLPNPWQGSELGDEMLGLLPAIGGVVGGVFYGGSVGTALYVGYLMLDWDKMQYRSKELIMLLQTWDMLKWSKKIDPCLEQPSRYRINEIADDLKDKWITPMHIRAKWTHYHANNNYTLMPAAALGMAAIVLHDYGDWILWYNGHPKEWAHPAHYNIHNTMWEAWTGAMSKAGGKYGYAEGTHYMKCFQHLLPFFRAYSNFLPVDAGKSYSSGLISPFYHYVKNYTYDSDYDNIYEWYNGLLQPDGFPPTIDDSWTKPAFNGVLALTKIAGSGKPGYNFVTNTAVMGISSELDLQADYLSALSKPSGINLFAKREEHMPGGNIIIRSDDHITPNERHYLSILAEKEPLAPNRLLDVITAHEQADACSFSIGAMDLEGTGKQFEQLAIDPPMRHTDYNYLVNEAQHHNTITIEVDDIRINDTKGPDNETESEVIEPPQTSPDGKFTKTKVKFKITQNFMPLITVTRTFYVYRGEGVGGYYYFINDDINNLYGYNSHYTYYFHGNGLLSEQTFVSENSNHTKARWFHPCDKSRDWGMLAEFTANDPAVEFDTTSEFLHGNNSSNYITNANNAGNEENWGFHTAIKGRATDFTKGLQFTTKLTPYKCSDIGQLGKTHMRINSRYSSQFVDSIGGADLQRFHFSRNYSDYPSGDTIIAPFETPNKVISTDATIGFYTQSRDTVFESGNCLAYTNFRDLLIDSALTFSYDSVQFLSANHRAEIYYSISGKYKYSGYCKTGPNQTTVDFYLPDLAQGVEMAVSGAVVNFTYDTTTFIMSVTFAANSRTKFWFQLLDPCDLSCYYPDTNTHIVSQFVQNGRIEPLSHKLKILQPNGYLRMVNGAKMSICENDWLTNKDSLILLAEPNNEPYSIPLKCNPSELITRALDADNPRSAIIVNDKATLILDSGSYTRIGANSSIYVLPGGSLIIKPYAVVEIGSDERGYGEILADQNAYVCVSAGADIKFHRNDDDSTDENLFYVILNNQTNPNTVNKTKAGINNDIFQMLVDDTLISSGHTCHPFCDYKSIIPPYGIGNRDWGYSPFVVPRAAFKVAGDTLCPGDSVVLDFRKVLNEEAYHFKICRVQDTLSTTNCIFGDTNMIEEDLITPSDVCIERTPVPDFYKFRLWDSGWYKINMNVINECGETHDSTRYVYVPAPPDIVIDIPDSICPGVGTLIADGSATQSHRTRSIYRWSIALISPDSIIQQGKGINYGDDWGEYDSTSVTDSFDFPGFRFYGGFKYAVGLSVKGWCGWVTKWDTVDVPLGVMIRTKLASNYQNPVGPSAFELKGYITGATSFNWNPTTDLDDPYSPVTLARPNAPVTYILEVTNGTCYDSDTIDVLHNDFAYAGKDQNICFDDTVVLGTDFNMMSFLALMDYVNSSDFESKYASSNSQVDFTTHFTHYMIDNYYGTACSFITLYNQDTTLRKHLFNAPYFKYHFIQYLNDNDNIDWIKYLADEMQNDTWLASHISTQGYSIGYSDVELIFNNFISWSDANIEYDILWEEKINDTTWAGIDSSDYFNIAVLSNKSKTYRMTVTNGSSVVEYDEVSLNRDTVMNIAFFPSQLIDSTVWFANASTYINNRTLFNWNFGDGSSSTLRNPSHTFPSKDSTYIICLTALNECDSFTYCDTLTLDSAGMYFTLGKKGNDPIKPLTAETDKPLTLQELKDGNKLHVNRPNPFSDKTIIEYELKDGYKDAEIRITNTLGQALKVLKLKGLRGYTLVDGSQWKDGMYFYSLVVDGVVISSKTMVVER